MITFLWRIKGPNDGYHRGQPKYRVGVSALLRLEGFHYYWTQLLHNRNDMPSIKGKLVQKLAYIHRPAHLYARASLKINVQYRRDIPWPSIPCSDAWAGPYRSESFVEGNGNSINIADPG